VPLAAAASGAVALARSAVPLAAPAGSVTVLGGDGTLGAAAAAATAARSSRSGASESGRGLATFAWPGAAATGADACAGPGRGADDTGGLGLDP
jgi:hypothetical protein